MAERCRSHASVAPRAQTPSPPPRLSPSSCPRTPGPATRRSSRATSRSPASAPSPAPRPPARFNLVGLHWRGPGRGAASGRARSSGRWSEWVDAAPRRRISRTRARPSGRARAPGGSATPGGSARRTGSSTGVRGRVTRLRAFFVWSPSDGVPGRTLQKAGAPPIVPRSGWRRGRVDQACGPVLRARRPARGRPSHRRLERLLAGRGAGDRQGDRDLPREGKRLERHRLQLPRRPVRPGLRGPVRRDRAERRSARTRRGSTPARSASRCSASTARWRSPAKARDVARAAARVAARPRPRRSGHAR